MRNNKIEQQTSPKGPATETEQEQVSIENETKEFQEQRERVKTILHAYYQEQQGNTEIHRQITEMTHEIRQLVKQALPYFQKKYEKAQLKEAWWVGRPYRSIGISTGEKAWEGETLVNFLLEQKDKQAQELGKTIQPLSSEISDLVTKLWDKKNKVAKQLLSLPEYSEWRGAKIERSADPGLYDIALNFHFEKEVYQDGQAKQEKDLFPGRIELINQKIMEKYNITEEERDAIVKIEWSDQEKAKLQNLQQGIEVFSKAMEEVLPLQSKDLSFTIRERENILDLFKKGKIRDLYKKLDLPPQHQERVIEQIMLGEL